MEDLKNIKRFTALMEESFAFNQAEYQNNSGWRVLWNLYNRNFSLANKSVSKLPKKIHQIWLGSKFPAKYKKWVDSWEQFNPDWEYRLWTDADLQESQVHIADWKKFNSIKNMGQKSDYLRCHILNQFGGLYIDTDFECLRSFDTLSYADFLVGIAYDPRPVLSNSIIGSIPHHPILEKAVHLLDRLDIQDITVSNIFETTGPYFFTKCFFDVVGEYMEGVVPLTPGYFYPFPNEKGLEDRRKYGKNYVKDYSYAIHYWGMTWMEKKK